MSRTSYAPKKEYTGTGSLSAYTFDFKIESLAQLEIVELNDSGVETQRVRGTDVVYLSTVTFDPVEGGGTVNLAANLTNNYKLFILLANDEPTQEYLFRNKGTFTLKRIELALDFIAGAVQRLAYRGKQALRLHDIDDEETISLQLPSTVSDKADQVLAINDTGDGVKYGPTTASIAANAGIAAQAAIDAATAQTAAELAQTGAETAQTAAELAQTGAETAQTAAELAQTNAETAQTAAELAETQAEFNAFLDAYTNQVSVTAASSPVTVAQDTLYICDTTAGDITFNLPALSGLVATWKAGFLKAVDAINDIIVDGNGVETVAGGLTRVTKDIGVGILVYPDTASNWNGPYYTAGFTPGGSGGAGGGGFTFVANQDIAAAGQINPNATAPQQWLKVTGDGGPQTTANAPLDTTPADGTLIVFEGQSDTNTLTIPYANVAGGFIGNGNAILRSGSTLTVAYDGSLDRLKEIQRKI